MKRAYHVMDMTVFIGRGNTVCCKCHHIRKDEPYVKKTYSYTRGKLRVEIICWKCLRDPHATRLVARKWPMAFERMQYQHYYKLEWSGTVQKLMEFHDEVSHSD